MTTENSSTPPAAAVPTAPLQTTAQPTHFILTATKTSQNPYQTVGFQRAKNFSMPDMVQSEMERRGR